MSQVTVTTTTPPVTVVCSRVSLITMMVTLAPTSVGQITLGLHDMVLLQQFIPRDTLWGSAVPQQQNPQLKIPSQAYDNYATCPTQVTFSSELRIPVISHVMCWCLLWCLLSAFRFPYHCHVHNRAQPLGFCNTTTLWSLYLAGICATWWWWSVACTRGALNGGSSHFYE